MSDIQHLVEEIIAGSVSGDDLKRMVDSGELSKTDRRKATKMAKIKKEKLATMSERQKLRLAVKEKKKLPKLSQTDRNARFRKDVELEREKESANFVVCLHCRKRGHYVKDCPRLASETSEKLFCYNCGSYNHCLRHCTQDRDPSGALPFAQCFVCKQAGHLARNCPQNSHGLYPKGGSCHICGRIDHLAKDCPDRPAEREERQESGGTAPITSDDALLGDYLEPSVEAVEDDDEGEKKSKKRKRKV